jgi:hypothetical protein
MHKSIEWDKVKTNKFFLIYLFIFETIFLYSSILNIKNESNKSSDKQRSIIFIYLFINF